MTSDKRTPLPSRYTQAQKYAVLACQRLWEKHGARLRLAVGLEVCGHTEYVKRIDLSERDRLKFFFNDKSLIPTTVAYPELEFTTNVISQAMIFLRGYEAGYRELATVMFALDDKYSSAVLDVAEEMLFGMEGV